MPIPRHRVPVVDRRELNAFRAGFKRSRKGNLWCRWGGLALVVFVRTSGRDVGHYGWVISAEDDRPVFSAGSFSTEGDAIEDLANVLEVGRG